MCCYFRKVTYAAGSLVNLGMTAHTQASEALACTTQALLAFAQMQPHIFSFEFKLQRGRHPDKGAGQQTLRRGITVIMCTQLLEAQPYMKVLSRARATALTAAPLVQCFGATVCVSTVYSCL